MILGFSEDFTSSISLDSELKDIPTSGLFLNSGVHPSINLSNLLDFLPSLNFTFSAWDNSKTYGVFLDSRDRTDIVTYNSKIYQSIKASNLNKTPDAEPTFWVETNVESLRLKIFIEQVKDRVYKELSLTKRLVDNQYLYENGDTEKTLPNNYAAWVIEPKGSDYVSIRINEMSIQADGVIPINVYVVHQNTLQETIQITPNNGEVSFVDTNILLSGKGVFKLVIDSQDVYVGNSGVNPYKFSGFKAYTASGTGVAPESATYTYNTSGIGVGLNITAYMDGNQYIDNNIDFIANFIRSTFEVMALEMFLHNSNNRSTSSQRKQMDVKLLLAELKDMQNETAIRRFHRERKKVQNAMEKTFDTQLNSHNKLQIKRGSV